MRAQHLRASPLCVLHLARGETLPATVVDHIQSIKDGGDPRDPTNLQSLCKPCHDSKTWTEINRRKRGHSE